MVRPGRSTSLARPMASRGPIARSDRGRRWARCADRGVAALVDHSAFDLRRALAAGGDADHRLARLWTPARTACVRPALCLPAARASRHALVGRRVGRPAACDQAGRKASCSFQHCSITSADPNAVSGFSLDFSRPARCLRSIPGSCCTIRAWKLTATASAGVPVKNYIDQSLGIHAVRLCARTAGV